MHSIPYPEPGKGLLPARILEMTDGGAPWELAGYASKFAARKAVLFAMLRAGWTREDAYRYLMLPDRPGYELWASDKRRLPAYEIHKRFARDWIQAEQYLDQCQQDKPRRGDVLALCGELRAVADTWGWPGRGWRNYRAVVLQAVTYAERKGSLVVGMPVRKVAEDIGSTHGTVEKYLDQARKDRWLTHLDREYGYGRGHVYLVNPHGPATNLLQTQPDVGVVTNLDVSDSLSSGQLCNTKRCTILYGTQLGRTAGKGKIDALVTLAGLYQETGEPQSAATVAAIIGVHRSTVLRQLRAMAGYRPLGLVTDTGAGWVCTHPEDYELDPDPGTAERQRAQHERERQEHRARRVKYLDEIHSDDCEFPEAA